MLTSTTAKSILCFGDSNTWGQKPEAKARFSAAERWTGVLQQTLGTDADVIEEGLNGRTTDLDYAQKQGLNGKAYLAPCVLSQNPLNAVVLMLGTNDCKIEFNRSAADIARAISGLVDDIRMLGHDTEGNPPRILVVSPAPINPDAENYTAKHTHHLNDKGVQVSQELAVAIAGAAKTAGCGFFDAGTVARVGVDGTHLTGESHKNLGIAIARVVKGWK